MKTYVLDFAEDWAPTAVDEREVEQFYAATAPPGGPPLEDVREHVIAALVRSKQSVIAAPTPAIDLHLLYTLGDFVELHRGGPKELVGSRYWTATEAVEHLSSLRPIIEAEQLPEDLKARTVEQVFAACDAIASVGAPVRLIEAAFEMALDDQVAVLAAAGIALHPDTTRAQLTSNYGEHEIAARPWECLHDFTEYSDHLSDLALKCIESEDDRHAYAHLVTAFARLARGQFPVERVSGDIDFVARTGFVEFTLDGKHRRIAADWNGEWLDMKVLAKLDGMLEKRAPGWGFYAALGGGEGMLTLATDRAGYQRLRAAGAPFTSLRGREH